MQLHAAAVFLSDLVFLERKRPLRTREMILSCDLNISGRSGNSGNIDLSSAGGLRLQGAIGLWTFQVHFPQHGGVEQWDLLLLVQMVLAGDVALLVDGHTATH